MRRLALPALALLLLAAVPPSDSVTLEGSVVVHGAQPGIVLGSTLIPPELHNRTCEVTFRTENNRSTHRTDVRVSTGVGSFVLTDVESGSGVAVEETLLLVSGETLSVILEATSGTTSLDFIVTAVCPAPEPDPLPEPEPEPEPEPTPEPTPEPEPEPEPDPEPEPTPEPEPEPTPERDCADGPDPDSDEFADADAWAAWYAANCDLPDGDPPADPDPPVDPGRPVDEPSPALPKTGGPVALLALLGVALTAGGLALTRSNRLHWT